MSNSCQICGKRRIVGGSIIRKGLPKKQGGIGLQLVKNNKRIFNPNIQSVRVKTEGGSRKMKVCAACIRSGNINKA